MQPGVVVRRQARAGIRRSVQVRCRACHTGQGLRLASEFGDPASLKSINAGRLLVHIHCSGERRPNSDYEAGSKVVQNAESETNPAIKAIKGMVSWSSLLFLNITSICSPSTIAISKMGSIPAQDEGAPPSIQDAGQLYLVGTGVSHAMAPVIHNSVAQQIGSKWHFSNLDVQTKEEALKYIRRADFKGCVPTMPLKIQLLDAVDEVDRAAQAIGAINNIYQRDGQLLGANTDWIGILRPLQKEMARQGVQISAQGASGWQGLIVGAGGASRAAAYALTKLGCQTIFIINRDDDEVKALVRDVQKGFTSVSMQVPTIEHLRTVEEAQRVVSQATGTTQPPSLLAVSCVPDLEPKSEAEERASAVLETVLTGTKGILLEMAYKPRITRTFLSAQTHGWRVIEGIHVIAEQVQTVWRLFSGIELTDGQARTAQQELWKQAATRDELNANGIPEPLSV